MIIQRFALNNRATIAAKGSVYHDVRETAQIIRKSPTWIYRQVRAGNLPHHRQGVSIFFTDGDIREILAAAARPAKKTRPASKSGSNKRDTSRPPRATAPAKPVGQQPEPERRLYVVGAGDIPQADPTASRKYRATS